MIAIDSPGTWLSRIASVGAFLFFALTLSAPSGYSYGTALLFLASVAFLCRRPHLSLLAEDKALAILFLAIFLISAFIFLLHGNPLKTLDQTSRYVLAIPVLFLLLRVPPSLSFVWGGLFVGGVTSVAITLWQRHWLGIARADGFVTSAIPYGDIALMIALLCIAGLFWACTLRRHAWLWCLALVLGALAGFYSFIASETRGGWLAVPPVVVLFFIAFARKHNVKWTIHAIVTLLLVVGVVLSLAPDLGIKARYDEAVKEVQMYRNQQVSDTSVGARLGAWHLALAGISEKPLLGWSYKDYDAKLDRLAAEKKIDPFVSGLSNTHNNYLEVWLHQGLFGLLALLTLYFYAFWRFCRRLRHDGLMVRVLAVSGASLMVSFFMFGMTQVILGRNNGVLFFLLTLIIFWACMRHEEGKHNST
ncbi:O-antigen ligase family protein [Paralcaligenes sp. KSB-10]|uniref:O-antigen ligase family protein n=1 Tax=Paralcaligenes sp. KSB-10 TaxID=2901142 RepID=UPI001E5BE45B|nr:O-antigen ligase family protein [Paralcaligenes sp. KSB-10]UHL63231.1 O-antigen ligase family protein [Paralcaligenes sp. KSB-10]